jgi:hypothetical protein
VKPEVPGKVPNSFEEAVVAAEVEPQNLGRSWQGLMLLVLAGLLARRT